MIQAIGSGIGADQDIGKRRYNRVIIMTDAMSMVRISEPFCCVSSTVRCTSWLPAAMSTSRSLPCSV